MVERVKANPDHLGSKSFFLCIIFDALQSPAFPLPLLFSGMTCFMLDVFKNKYSMRAPPQDAPQTHASPTSPISSTSCPIHAVETRHSQHSDGSDVHSIVAPNLISKYEMKFWYYGISTNPPELMWRSDVEVNPFPTRPPGARFFNIPVKTVHSLSTASSTRHSMTCGIMLPPGSLRR